MSGSMIFDETNLEELLTAYKSDKRLMIRNLLTIYKELSLTELANHMQMSKTAVHHHLKILREANMVEVAREEEARGSIDRKYFQLTKGQRYFKVEDLDQIEDINRRYKLMKTMTKTLEAVYREVNYRMDLMINYTRFLENQLDKLDESDLESTELANLQTDLVNNNTHLRNIPLGKKQFEEFIQLKEEFLQKISEMKEETKEEDYPYLAILIDIPIRSLLEFNIERM